MLTSFVHLPIPHAVPPTLTVPLVGRGCAPPIVHSGPTRKRSRLCAKTVIFIGAVSATSHCFLESIARFTGRMGTKWPDLPNYDGLLLRNSKLGPRQNSKLRRACGDCEHPKFEIACPYIMLLLFRYTLSARVSALVSVYVA